MSKNWILLRGLTRGNGHWGEFPQVMVKKGASIELMEIPGNGTWNETTTPIDPMKIIQQIKIKSEFIRQNKPFNVCGISLGGMIALKWAESYPQDIESVAIINSSLSQYSPFYQRLIFSNYPAIIKALFEKSYLEREKIILKLTSSNIEAQTNNLQKFAIFSQQYPIRPINFFRQIYLANNVKLNKKISIPVKIIVSENDKLVSPSSSLAISKAIGHPVKTHPTAGHDLPLDAPEWLAEIILN